MRASSVVIGAAFLLTGGMATAVIAIVVFTSIALYMGAEASRGREPWRASREPRRRVAHLN